MNIQGTDLYFGLFLNKLRMSTFQEKKDLWCTNEDFQITLLQRHHEFCGVIIFS